ncbi:MAG: hypothetical protein QOH71_871 [Blastocatellia bacterium]|jgi:hypothetical protein|nr:hypothetical protein [Blastocatellia bacterium]
MPRNKASKSIFKSLLDQYRVAFFLCLVLLGGNLSGNAFETDQYDLPPIPLADIGDEVSDRVEQKLHEAIDKLNSEIAKSEACLNHSASATGKSCNAVDGAAKLEYLRSNDAVAHAAYEALGTGIPPFSTFETWMEKHRFKNQPARYKISFWKSISLAWPTDAFMMSPTVKLYGSEFGTDKLGHSFQQGYTYYKIYRRSLTAGATPEKARHKAVEWGRTTEQTFYGTLLTGVYSNGDLFANYVGLQFYQGLTREIKVRTYTRPPILILKNGSWVFNDRVNMREVLLKPFVSDQLNEALNPSIFTQLLDLRGYVRRKVASRSCARWFNRYTQLSRAGLEEESRSLEFWYGEDYGFTNSELFITIGNTCFDENGKPKYRAK